jgi:hypothetical protein
VVVIDESLAAKYFPDRDPIGRYLDFNTNPTDPDKTPNPQIIGVIGHVNQWGLADDGIGALRAQVYLPFAQISDKDLQRGGLDTDVFIRQKSAGAASVAALRSRALEFNAELVIHNSEDMAKTVANTISGKRFTMSLLGVFALLALLLASIGGATHQRNWSAHGPGSAETGCATPGHERWRGNDADWRHPWRDWRFRAYPSYGQHAIRREAY